MTTEPQLEGWRQIVDADERASRIAIARTRVTDRQMKAEGRAAVASQSDASPQTDVGDIWIGDDPAVTVWLIKDGPRTILADVDDAGADLRRLMPALSKLAAKSGGSGALDFSEYAGDGFAGELAAATSARRTATKMQIEVDGVPDTVGVELRPMIDAEFDAYRSAIRHDYAEEWLASGLANNLEEALHVADTQMDELLPQQLQTAEHRLFTVRDENDERVGVLWIHLGDQRAFIYDIAMDLTARGRGYGTQTLRAAAAEVRAAGLDVLALNVFGSNDGARRLYTREGYRVTEILWSATLPVEPSRSIEVERKYDVDVATPLPAWTTIPGVTEITPGELRVLDARYFDTADAALSRAGVALRRRTGGPDEGWHVKGPREGDGRLELGWPLGDDDELPDAVATAIARWTTEPLSPLARIENDRTAYLLTGPDGVIAEFVDDHVRAIDLRQTDLENSPVQREWREWEMELGPAAPADAAGREEFFAAIETAVFAAGGRHSASGSKLARALGF